MSSSPIGTCPVWTARLISGILIREPFECTVIVSLPPVALATSSANCTTFLVWKFVSGYGVGMSQRVWAAARALAATRAAAIDVLTISVLLGSAVAQCVR